MRIGRFFRISLKCFQLFFFLKCSKKSIKNTKNWWKLLYCSWYLRQEKTIKLHKIDWENNNLFLILVFENMVKQTFFFFDFYIQTTTKQILIFCFLYSDKILKNKTNPIKQNYTKTSSSLLRLIPRRLWNEDYEIFKQISQRRQKIKPTYLWSWLQRHKPLTSLPPTCLHHQT